MEETKQKQRVQIGYVVSNDGEIMKNIYEGDRLIHPKQDEYKNKHHINFKKGEAFVKVFTNPIPALYKELPTKEFAVAMAIMPFISYKDGILRYNGKIVDGKTISDLLCENYETFKRIITALIKKDILKRVKRPSDTYANKEKNCIVVNPFIYLRGQDIEKEIVDLFKETKWATLYDEF